MTTPATAPKRILLAGSSMGSLRGGAQVLERAGYDVVSVDSAELLEPFTAGTPPDLVVLDEAFGERGGVAVSVDMRRSAFWRGVSIMLAVPAGEAHLEECLVAGINDFILAPFPGDELLDKVKRLTVIPARREVNTLVTLREESDSSAETLLGKTLNVSNSGLLVEIESLLAIGRNVDVSFFLPDDPNTVKARGRVIRRAQELSHFHPAFGIRFLSLSEADRLRIESYVGRREKAAS
ncbi:MAG: PilZ domain-containing protein [Acidobacteria bacterium]|nr:PilZ domain-containing protein [Acidobacteriota bacterium]